jgi:hypothetical protein
MDAILYKNGTQVTVKEKTLKAYTGIMTTDNPGSKSVVDSVNLAGGLAFADALAANGELTDVFKVVKTGKKSGGKVITTGEGSRSQLVERIRMAMKADEWQVKITIEQPDKQNTAEDTADDSDVEVL